MLVLACSVARLRFTWWPIHPILFLIWGIWPLAVLGSSFLIGWFCKWAIVHFGGGKAYRANKPLFVGMVAGHMCVMVVWAIWGLIYYAIYGVPGPSYWFWV